jgi:hypothetical protein
MVDWLKDLAKQPWWVLVLLTGAILVVIPTIGLDRTEKGYVFGTHPPTTLVPVGIGMFFMILAR